MTEAIEVLKNKIKEIDEKITILDKSETLTPLSEEQKLIRDELANSRGVIKSAIDILNRKDEILLLELIMDADIIDLERVLSKKGYRK